MRRALLMMSCLVVTGAGAAWGQGGELLASTQNGDLYRIDVTTALAAPVRMAAGTGGSTEIEADVAARVVYMEGSDGATNLDALDTCRYHTTRTVNHASGALNGLEFVGTTLYGAFIPNALNPSDLVTVDTTTGALATIGATGFGPIAGLAYDTSGGIMYGVTGGGAAATLVTINLGTGVATAVAGIADAAGAPLDRIGGLAFGADGNLYGGTTGTASMWPSSLIRINTTTAVATLVGATGVSCTGLTDLPPCAIVPATGTVGRLVFIVLLAAAATLLLARRAGAA